MQHVITSCVPGSALERSLCPCVKPNQTLVVTVEVKRAYIAIFVSILELFFFCSKIEW